MNKREKLAAAILSIVILVSGASIGWSCAQFIKRDTINKLFMCSCGKVYLLHIDGENIQIIEIKPPDEDKQQGTEQNKKKKDKWI